MAELDDLSGRMLGEFVLSERLDEGGFGAVYRCEQPLLGREAVVKVLHRGLRRQDGALKRFLREAQLASKLDHPYAAHVYAFGVEEDDEILWIAMELVQGVTLNRWLRTHGPMPLDEFVPFFERVAEVVQAAHERGIVHRDLKPSNVMIIERAGRLLPKLLDFGVAKLLGDVAVTDLPSQWPAVIPGSELDPTLVETLDDTERTPRMRITARRVGPNRLTRADAAIGSPPYMSPEQWNDPTAVGPASDLYSLGVIAYEALTGRRPFTADTIEAYSELHRDAPIPPLGEGFSPALDRLFQRALAKRPEARWGSALELAAALRAELKTRMRSQVRTAAQQWHDRGRPAELLWRGTVLADLERWMRTAPELEPVETEFVGASRKDERALAAARVRRKSRIRRWLVAGVAATALAAIQYRAYLKTEMAEQVAQLSITQAEVEQGRQALLHGDSAEAQTHLLEAYKRGDRSPGTQFMLARALQPLMAEKARFQATYGRMWSAVFSPDGSRIVTTDDRAAQVWDAKTHKLLLTLTHGDSVYQAVYSQDGSRVVTGGRDGSVRIWNAATGALIHELRYGDQATRQWEYFRIALTNDGRLVAALDMLGKVAHVWDARTGVPLAELQNDNSDYPSLGFSADGNWLATSGGNNVRIFNTADWTQAFALDGIGARALNFDQTGSRLLTGTSGGDVALWDIPSGKRLHHFREIGEAIDAVAFSPNGKLLVIASHDGSEQVWNVGSGLLQSQFNHHHGRILSVEFDATSQLVVSAGAEGVVAVSDVSRGMPVVLLTGARNAVRVAHFDPTSHVVVAASWDGTARLWDVSSPYQRWASSSVSDHCGVLASAEPDRRFIAMACQSLPTRIWDTVRGKLLVELPSMTPVDGDIGSTFPAVSIEGDRAAIARGDTVEIYSVPSGLLLRSVHHAAPVKAVAFARTGHDLVSGSIDGAVLVTRDAHDPIALPASPGAIDAVSVLGDGRIVTSDAQRHLRVYLPDRSLQVVDLRMPMRAMLLRPSEHGDRLVTVGSYTSAERPALWDLEHYQFVARLDGHVGLVRSARFVRGGTAILTAGADGTARLWDALNGRLRQTYRGGAGFLVDATLDPNGAMVVAGGADGLLRFWDFETGRPLWTLLAHKSYLVGVHFEADDVVTRGFGGDLARWHLPKPRTIIEGCGAEATFDEAEACTKMPR